MYQLFLQIMHQHLRHDVNFGGLCWGLLATSGRCMLGAVNSTAFACSWHDTLCSMAPECSGTLHISTLLSFWCGCHCSLLVWANCNGLTATSLESWLRMSSKQNYPKVVLFQATFYLLRIIVSYPDLVSTHDNLDHVWSCWVPKNNAELKVYHAS